MLSNLSNNNAGNATKSVVEKKHYEDIEKRIDEMQEEIDATAADVSVNSQAISNLKDRVDAVEDNSTFPELNTDTINPVTGNKIDVTSDFDVDGEVEANSIKTNSLSVNGTSFTTVKDDAAQAKSTAEIAENKADEAYDLADAVADELADYKADNEQSFTTGTLNADSVIADSVAAQTINTNDFETTNAEIDKLYVDTIKATGFLELPTAGQSYYTITVPAKTTASFSGVYTSDNNTDYPFYFTVSDGAVIYKQGSTEIIKDISFDRETGYTKVRVKSSTNITYISSALDSNPVTIEDGGNAYTDYAFIPQKTGGYLVRGYDDTTTEIYIAGVLKAYALSIEEEIIERTSVDFLKVNASIELPKDWDAGGTISYSTGEENEYISAQTKAGVTKPAWTSPIHSTIGSLSYSSKLVDEATIASYKGISETRQTQTISITEEASLQQLTAFHWTKNGTYWQPYETTRITIGDHTMWIDPTESNQGIRFYDNQVIADGTWDDTPVEEANAVPVNLVIFDAPTEFSFPITNLGDKTTVHGEITATCFKGNVLGNVTGNADTATNATCFDGKTYTEAKTDILSGCAADSNKFNGKTYSEACADILSGNAATATNATCFDGCTYSEAKADILSGCASEANNATCFDGCTYAQAKADILSGNAASATNATCFNGCTYSQAKADILSGNAATATNSTCFGGCTYAQAKADIRNYTPSYATCTSCPIIHATTDTVATQYKIPFAKYTGSANDETPLVCDKCLIYTTVQQRLSTPNLCVSDCAEITSAHILCLQTYNTIDGKAREACCSNCAHTVFTSGSANTKKLLSSKCGWSTPSQTCIDYTLDSNTLSNVNIDISGCSLKAATGCFTGNVEVDCNVNIGGDLNVAGTITTTHSEEVITPSENILLRDGASTAIPSGHYSGFTVTNYDGHNNNLEVGANSDGTLHIGTTTGIMEPVATRACEACMEDGYVVHWDPTGTDLITKGATNTHDLTVNGNATVTGTLTADLTGTADNATKFDGCTYSQAKADILSGNAATSTNATCFDGCTYSQAKADILSGCAANADNATCFGGCTYAQACADILAGTAACATNATNAENAALATCATQARKIDTTATNTNADYTIPLSASNCIYTSNGKTLSYNPSTGLMKVDGVETAGYKAVLPSPNNTIHYALVKVESVGNEASVPLCVHVYNNDFIITHSDNSNTAVKVLGNGATVYGLHGAASMASSDGSSYYWLKTCNYRRLILSSICPVTVVCNVTTAPEDVEFTAPSIIACTSSTVANATCLGGQVASYYLNTSSTTQCKSGTLNIGNPSSATSTSDGSQGTSIHNDGTVCLYSSGAPYVSLYHCNASGFSSRIVHGHDSTNNNGHLCLWVRNSSGTAASSQYATYDFGSNGIFKGAICICASCNIYSAGCPVVTTGTLPTVAPGYNCTGTSNYVVTTKVCCAEKVESIPSAANTSCTALVIAGCCNGSALTTTTYCFKSDGTFCGATSVYQGTNKVVDTGGGQTINGNLTIPTACGSFCGNLCGSASAVNRTATHNNAICHLALLGGCTSTNGAEVYVSDTCPLTYNPSTGALTACTVNNSLGKVYGTKVGLVATDIGLTAGCSYSLQCVVKALNAYSTCPGTYNFLYYDLCSFYIQNPVNGEGKTSYEWTFEKLDSNDTVHQQWRISRWNVTHCSGASFIVSDSTYDTPDSHTYSIRNVSSVAQSVCNVPSTASTTCNVTITAGCCSATAATNYTWCFCGDSGSFRSPNTVCVGSGNIGTATAYGTFGRGGIELSSSSPFLDFHFNCYCGDYSTRLINDAAGVTKLIVNNGTGTTTATQTGTFNFYSDGVACIPKLVVPNYILPVCSTSMVNNCAYDICFGPGCKNSAGESCFYWACFCGSDGKLYNPQGFVGPVTGTADCATYAKTICSGTISIDGYNCNGNKILYIEDSVTGSSHDGCISIGWLAGTGVLGNRATAIGAGIRVSEYGTAVGTFAYASTSSVSIGYTSTAYGSAVSAGECAVACCNSVSIGYHARANCDGVAIGSCAIACGFGSIAIGKNTYICCCLSQPNGDYFKATVIRIGDTHAHIYATIPKCAWGSCTFKFLKQLLSCHGRYAWPTTTCTVFGKGVGLHYSDDTMGITGEGNVIAWADYIEMPGFTARCTCNTPMNYNCEFVVDVTI